MISMVQMSLARPLAVGLTAVLAGCATTQMKAEWWDPDFSVASLNGRRVLVVCRAPDEAMRRVCEDQWSFQLGARGVVAAQSYATPRFPWASGDVSDEMKAAVRASNVAALASMSL
jgi:hypothetical protein